jgi:hypothetical protein
MVKNTEKKEILECDECGKQPTFFDSSCCHADFRGVLVAGKKHGIVCVKCGKFLAWLAYP